MINISEQTLETIANIQLALHSDDSWDVSGEGKVVDILRLLTMALSDTLVDLARSTGDGSTLLAGVVAALVADVTSNLKPSAATLN